MSYTLPDSELTNGGIWPPEVPKPDLSKAQYNECRSAWSDVLWVGPDGSTYTTPYPCKGWPCEQHHEAKANPYVLRFEGWLDLVPAVYVGGFSTGDRDAASTKRGSDSLRQRATDYGGISYVRVWSGEVLVWFAAADMTLNRPRSTSVAAEFVEVSREEALAMFRYLTRHSDVRVSGNKSEPVWRPPERYSRDGMGSGVRKLAQIPKGEAGRRVREDIALITIELLPNPVTPEERELLVSQGFVPGGLKFNTRPALQTAVVEAAQLYFAESEEPDGEPRGTPQMNGWETEPSATTKGRHLRSVPIDPDGAATTTEEAA